MRKMQGQGVETSSFLRKTLVVYLENHWNFTSNFHVEEKEILATARWFQFWHQKNELLDEMVNETIGFEDSLLKFEAKT